MEQLIAIARRAPNDGAIVIIGVDRADAEAYNCGVKPANWPVMDQQWSVKIDAVYNDGGMRRLDTGIIRVMNTDLPKWLTTRYDSISGQQRRVEPLYTPRASEVADRLFKAAEQRLLAQMRADWERREAAEQSRVVPYTPVDALGNIDDGEE